jgi:hypothetical protein
LLKLDNPTVDTTEVTRLLPALGFKDLRHCKNLDYNDMEMALNNFYANLDKEPTTALFYYSGHGVQYEDENYLLPVDAQLHPGGDIGKQGFSLTEILEEIVKRAEATVAFIDACRDGHLDRGNGPSRGPAAYVGRPVGLRAQPKMNRAFIGFSTQPEHPASDGLPGRHSPFARAFLRHIDTPQQTIDTVWDRIVTKVMEETNDQQEPSKSTGLSGFCLIPPPPLASEIRARLSKMTDHVESALDRNDSAFLSLADDITKHLVIVTERLSRSSFSAPRTNQPPSLKESYLAVLLTMYRNAREEVFATSRTEYGPTWAQHGKDIITAHKTANVPVKRVFLLKGKPSDYESELRTYQRFCSEIDVKGIIETYVHMLPPDETPRDELLELNDDYTLIDDGRFVGITKFVQEGGTTRPTATWFYRDAGWTPTAQAHRETLLSDPMPLEDFLAQLDAAKSASDTLDAGGSR